MNSLQKALQTRLANVWKRKAQLTLPDPVDGAKWIPLTRGHFVLVDDCDFERVSRFTWTAKVYNERRVYARSNGAKKIHKTDLLHRWLMDAPCDMEVDHRNGNGLDCRRSNMRVCTASNNHKNLRKTVRKTSSRFKGVYLKTRDQRWIAHIKKDWKNRWLGSFDKEEDAALAYNRAAVALFGEFAKLNII